jgi:hypothetical protein
LITLIVLAILATLGGFSLPTNSWLNEYQAPLFTKVATGGTPLWNIRISVTVKLPHRGISRNWNCLCKIHEAKIKVPKMLQ